MLDSREQRDCLPGTAGGSGSLEYREARGWGPVPVGGVSVRVDQTSRTPRNSVKNTRNHRSWSSRLKMAVSASAESEVAGG